MKKIFVSLLLLTVFAAGFCLSVSAADSGYGHVTYVNPFYQDYTMPHYASSGAQNASSETEDIIYYTNYEDVGEALLAGLLTREEQITVGYHQTEDATDDFIVDIFNEAIKHTGVPDAGDYLRYNLGGFQCDYAYQSSDTGTIYTLTYHPQYYTDAEQEAELAAEIDRVLSLLDVADADEYEKSTALYDYICSNVVYDYANLNDELYNLKYTAYAALIDGTAVCQGYATLYYRMALELGLDARVITGFGGDERHAWNIVKIDDLYYNLDATWDAETSPYQYYLRCDANFTNHQRNQEMLTEEFYTAYPMSPEDYVFTQFKGTCGDDLRWILDKDGTLTISGSGKMYDYGFDSEDGTTYSYYVKPWESYGDVKKLVIEQGVTSIGYAAFINQTQLEEVVFHNDSITEIGDHAFANTHITNPVVFPDSLCSIGNYAFEGSTISGTVTFGDTLENIDTYAFLQCSSITELDFPKTLQSLGTAAFYGCSSLKNAIFAGSPPEIGNMAFDSTSPDLTFTYTEGVTGWTTPTWTAPDGTVYNTVMLNASEEPDPENVTSGTCGQNATWSVSEDGVLTISGTGAIQGYETPMLAMSEAPYRKTSIPIKSLVIEDGIQYVGSFAFVAMRLESVTIADSVLTMGQMAFSNIPAAEIKLPKNLIAISLDTFAGCRNLTEITIPSTVNLLEHGAFGTCSSLKKAIFLGNVPQYLGEEVFDEAAEDFTIYYYEGTTGWDAAELAAYNKVMLSESGIPHTHTITAVPAKEATCIETGYEAYYICSAAACGKLFADADGKIEIAAPTEIAIDADNHKTLITVNAKDASETEYGYTGDTVCDDCKATLEVGSLIDKIILGPVQVQIPVEATVTGSVVTVESIDESVLEFGNKPESGDTPTESEDPAVVSIDLTDYGTEIEEVVLPTQVIETIADVVEDTENTTEAFAVHLSAGTMQFDDKALRAVAEQSDSTTVKLVIDDKTGESLNDLQEEALKKFDVYGKLDIYMVCEETGTRISDFNGGTVTLQIPFEIPENCYSAGFQVWYVDENGNCTPMETRYENGNIVWDVEHFSDYVIIYIDPTHVASVTGTITSWDSNPTTDTDDTITVTLANASNTYSTTVISEGVNQTADYSFDDVASGIYTMTVSKAGHVTGTYTVVIGGDDVTLNASIYLLGDTNHDGKADSSDAVSILRKLAGYDVPNFYNDTADFNGDGKADSSDAVAILRKLAGY
ncbi:MAG: leucine-rich repeat protein [Clostridia bacterium]|nr:leucine-rich repeat protein [Clostridia bacterium]